MRKDLDEIQDEYKEKVKQGLGDESDFERFQYATPFFTQLKYTCKRAALNTCRNPQTSLLPVSVPAT